MTGARSLLSFVPNAIRRRVVTGDDGAPSVERFDAVVLVADISGFTPLAMSLSASGGVEQLSRILNDGFGRLIDAIVEEGGDVVGFAGDAITAIWPADTPNALGAVSAALEAQRRMADADHRVNLRIGLDAGPVALWTLGNDGSKRQVLLTGRASLGANDVQQSAPVTGVAVTSAIADLAGTSLALDIVDDVHVARAVQRGAVGAPARRELDDGPVPDGLSRYLPASVIARISAGQDQFLAELRPVTSLLVMVDIEDVPDDLDGFQSLVSTIEGAALRFGATVTSSYERKGFTCLLLFGAPPFVHEHNVDRALLASQHIVEQMPQVRFGIGVASGRAFCGAVGTTRRREFCTLAEAVNVTSRLADQARRPELPTVLCEAGSIAEAEQRGWEFAPPISLRAKGLTELLTAASPVRRLTSAGVQPTTLVDRPETAEVLDRLSADHSASVVIEGEPGAGKSSMVSHICDSLSASDVRFVSGWGDELERGAFLHPWITVLLKALDLDDSADLLRASLDAMSSEERSLLSALLDLPVAGPPALDDMAPEDRVERTYAAIGEVIRLQVAEHGRLVILLEDAHWFDSASLGVLGTVAGIEGVAVIVTTRPDATASSTVLAQLIDTQNGLYVRLEPFDRETVEHFAQLALGVEHVDVELTDLLIEQCRGNPYFTSEVLQSLVDQQAIAVEGPRARLVDRDAIAMPESIQAAIGSRIDRLTQHQQLTLKVASVVGTPFDSDIVTRIHPTDRTRADVMDDLVGLVTTGLITPIGQQQFAFHHAFGREVAYNVMMNEQRRELHRAVAEYHEETSTETERLYPLLAHHWLRAEHRDKAVDYLSRASVSSLTQGMPSEATNHGITAARLLGTELITDPAEIGAILPKELAEIDRLMAGRRPADLAALPELIDPDIGNAIGVILQTMPSAHQSLQAELFALMAIRNLNLTLRFGAGVLAPGVYSMYSIVLRGLGLDSATASAFSDLARVVDAANGDVLSAVVKFIHVFFNRHWFNSLEESYDIAMAGAEAGLAGPDLLYGSFNLAAATVTMASSGASTDDIVATARHHAERIGNHSKTALFHCQLESQTAMALAGGTEGLTSLSDDWCSEEELEAITATHNFNQAAYFHIAKLRLALLAGDHRSAADHADQAYVLLPSFAGQLGQVELTPLAALARLGAASDDVERSDAVTFATSRLAELDEWTTGCPVNFAHKASLVRAAIAATVGDDAAANDSFASAVEQADAAGFRQWASLATEWWADAATTDPTRSAELVADSAARYRAWGAHAKAAQLENR